MTAAKRSPIRQARADALLAYVQRAVADDFGPTDGAVRLNQSTVGNLIERGLTRANVTQAVDDLHHDGHIVVDGRSGTVKLRLTATGEDA